MDAEQSNITRLLESISREASAQNAQLKQQLRITRWIAAFCACLAAVAVIVCVAILPHATAMITQAGEIMTEVQQMSATASDTLKKADELVTECGVSITAAIEDVHQAINKLKTLDIDSMNEAIANLANIVRPLAALLA